jgi:hypothetical protein
MYQPEQHRGLTARFSQDIGISALSLSVMDVVASRLSMQP